jgi:hypothetical protein
LRAPTFRRTSKDNVSGGLGGMNDQWGRSGSGRPASGGGIGGMLFASVVSLALGAAGGYGAFRMMDGAVPTNEIEARDQRIADLAKELDARVAQVEENTQKAQRKTVHCSASSMRYARMPAPPMPPRHWPKTPA